MEYWFYASWHIHGGRQDNTDDFYTEKIAFYIVPQTRDVFITAINICQLDISLANNVYCTCTYFSADSSDRAV